MLVRIWVVVERPLRGAFFRPRLQRRQLLERRQVVAAAGCYELLNCSRLRQMDQQALGSFLVLGEAPDAPEVRKEGSKSTFGSGREAVRPALLSDLRRVTFGDCPGAGRVHDHCALAGNEPLVVIGVVPRCYVRGQEWAQ